MRQKLRQKINMILLTGAVMTLSACAGGHETLKAPCSPIAGMTGSPCTHMPVNLAAL